MPGSISSEINDLAGNLAAAMKPAAVCSRRLFPGCVMETVFTLQYS
ncbi:MAG: hypothetical protein PHU70_10530 [Dehalococcoidia bacterium]|nr:hypothetical protein [Dehalococcoidia bacterium]